MVTQEASVDNGTKFVNQLYQMVIGPGEFSPHALEELSKIAMGGHTLARELINRIDQQVLEGALTLPKPVQIET